jgi:hypothetical protein
MQDTRGNRPDDDEFVYGRRYSIDPHPDDQLAILWRERDHRLWLRAMFSTQLKLYGLLISVATALGVLASTIVGWWVGFKR